jgi:hypothetical protein
MLARWINCKRHVSALRVTLTDHSRFLEIDAHLCVVPEGASGKTHLAKLLRGMRGMRGMRRVKKLRSIAALQKRCARSFAIPKLKAEGPWTAVILHRFLLRQEAQWSAR